MQAVLILWFICLLGVVSPASSEAGSASRALFGLSASFRIDAPNILLLVITRVSPSMGAIWKADDWRESSMLL